MDAPTGLFLSHFLFSLAIHPLIPPLACTPLLLLGVLFSDFPPPCILITRMPCFPVLLLIHAQRNMIHSSDVYNLYICLSTFLNTHKCSRRERPQILSCRIQL
ncbi:hypothetical protein DFH06DRAFT_1254976 [Mycena polygramma]|nr:hypothetical protein DFH06DRAFT_1254976 [Mycena polygramma]